MEDHGPTLRELVGVARRQAWRMAAVAALLLVLGLPVALYWPAVYRSSATILVEEQEIPRDLVRSTITTYADERIQVISQQVMTRATLNRIIEKYDLYAKERRYVSNEEIFDRMRRDIRVQTVSSDSAPRFGQRAAPTIAFKLSYDSEAPAKAQQVANELVSLYLNENLRTRQQRADETSQFLGEEAERIGRQIAEIEAKLAAFKRANAGRLPELQLTNLQMRDRAESELDEAERQIRVLEDRRIYLESQLTLLKENAPVPTERVLEPEERLRSLRNQYASQSGVYGESHPDLARMRREMEMLEKSTGSKAAPPDARTVDEARNELKRLSDRYGADHPDVQRQAKRVSALEADAAREPAAAKKPDNPAYVSMAAQIASAAKEAESLRKRREDLRARVASYNARIEQTPGVEQAYRDLVRDHENATAKYKDLRAKQMEAQVALALEKDRKGERFSLIDPPQYPEKPAQPDRKKLLALAFASSLGGGIGTAVLAESINRTVKSARMLGLLLESPVLGVLPLAADPRAALRRRRWLLIAVLSALGLGLVGLAVVHFFVMPLESLWYVLLRRLQL